MRSTTTPIIDVKKYGGKQVAIVRGRIVASGRTTLEVLERAKKSVSRNDHDKIWLLAVPKSFPIIYRLCN